MNMEELLPAAPEKVETVTAKPAKKKPAPGKFLDEHWAEVEEKKARLETPEKPEPVEMTQAAKTLKDDYVELATAILDDDNVGPVFGRDTVFGAIASETARMLNTPLYSMVDDYNALVDYLVERDGVMDEDSIAAWSNIRGTVAEKLENCGKLLRELAAKEANLKDESKRMGARAKAIKNSHTRLKDYAKAQMIRMDMKKCEGVVINLTVANTAPKCNVYDESQVPDEFCNVSAKFSASDWTKIKPAIEAILGHSDLPVDRSIDKPAVVTAWKAVAGAVQTPGTIVEKGTSLTIR